MLGRAFADDPVSNYMFAGPRRLERGLRSFFAHQLRYGYLPLGHVYTTEGCTGVALWAPPDRQQRPVAEVLRVLPTAPYIVSRRLRGALELLARVEKLHPTEPHWYLFTIGTEPKRQGQGIGSALLRTALQKVDEDAMPAYLESSKERNVPLYARFGFEVIGEITPMSGSPTIWRMWREPREPEV